MAGTAIVNGNQTAIMLGAGTSPETYSLLAYMTDIGGFGQESALIEVTHFQSLAKEYIYSIPDSIEFTIAGNYLPQDTNHKAMFAAQANRLTKGMRIVLPDSGGTFQTQVLTRRWELQTGPNVAQRIQWTVKPTGVITGP
jgi:hypothetical protein